MYYELTIKNIFRILKPGGFFIFTCASGNRPEHGTRKSEAWCAPLLNNIDGWCDYYKNLNKEDIERIDNLDKIFQNYYFEFNSSSNDLYFYGIKRG